MAEQHKDAAALAASHEKRAAVTSEHAESAKPYSAKQFSPVARSPLSGHLANGSLNMREIAEQTLVNLRGNPDDEQFMRAAESVLGTPLPITPNTVATAAGHIIFWLGPDEWLVRTNADMRDSTLAALQEVREKNTAAVTDVSDYYVIIRISGAAARNVLAAGCPLDLATLSTGGCAQTRYAKAAILLWQQDNAPSFDLQVRWSFADYLWNYLCEATG